VGQLALSKGPARMVIRCHVGRAAIPNKVFSLLHNELMHALNIITCDVCVSDKEKYSYYAG
jgi:hypothetical protein